jgi:hypothetical protein
MNDLLTIKNSKKKRFHRLINDKNEEIWVLTNRKF